MVGSEDHKLLFCRSFIDTHRTFEPTELPWPDLDDAVIRRLRAIPFWRAALTAERNAGVMVTGFAERCADPLIREAMAIQGVEETRHGKLLATMLDRYGLDVKIAPAVGIETTQHAFVAFGYEECIDSFFGFGIFGLAKAIRLFHDDLFDIFEHVLLEETRHVVFFVNWIAYERAQRGLSALPLETLLTGTGYFRAVGRLLAAFGPQASLPEDRPPLKQELGFAAAGVGDVIEGVTWRSFLQACVDENARRMAEVDPRLLQPRVLPALAKAALAIPPRPELLGGPPPGQRLTTAR